MNLIQELIEVAHGRRCRHCNVELSLYFGECYGHPTYDEAMEALKGINSLLTELMDKPHSREEALMRRQICNFIHKEVVVPVLFETLVENKK